MKSRRRFLGEGGLAAIGACFHPTVGRAQENPGAGRGGAASASLIADLEGAIPNLMDESAVPGLSIAVVQDAKLLWRRGFGVKDRFTKAPVDDQTVFEAASVSKTVFAYAVMKLCEDGILSLDTPLTKYTHARFLDGDPRLDFITARHLLSHTGGFQDWRSKAAPLKIHFAPGGQFLYSGEGYSYLQSVVTELTGKVNTEDCARFEADLEVCATDIDSWLKARLLTPFGMRSSGYVWNGNFESHAARPHDSSGKPIAKSKPTSTSAARYAAAGGLHTTAEDYAKFLVEVLGPKSADAVRLSRASRQEMLRPQVKLNAETKIDGASAWALGWAVRERVGGNLIVHSGGQAGFQSLAVASVERKSGFIILTNSDNGWKIFHHRLFVEIIGRLFSA